MFEPIVFTFMALSTDYKKNSYLANVIPFEGNDIEQIVDVDEQNYFEGFIRIDNVNKIKNHLFNLLNQSSISYPVYNNASNLLVNLPEIVLDKIDIDNIYQSNYGTVMVDFEPKDNDIFSLEIGRKSIGYFSEVNDLTYSYCDELETINEAGETKNSNVVSEAVLDFLSSQNIV
jgi:hypothetical protein